MEAGGSKTRRIVIVVSTAIALAVVSVIAISVHAQRVERARIAARLDDLGKQMTTLQAEMASAPIPTVPVPSLADAAIGDFPTPQIPPTKSQLTPIAPDATRQSGRNDPGY